MTEKKSFILYHDFYGQMQFLTIEQRGELLTMIYEYAVNGTVMGDTSPMAQFAFAGIRGQMDRDLEKYEEKCRINAEKGKKGGRPKKATVFSAFEEKAEKPDNDNGNDNDTDNDNDNGNGGDKENENDNGIEGGGGEEYDLAARGMVSLSSKAPPPPSSEDREKFWEELMELGVPSSYAEARLARAYHFARTTKRSISEILYEWWQEDKQGSPKNAEPPPPDRQKTYDLEDFFQAALARSYEDMEWA